MGPRGPRSLPRGSGPSALPFSGRLPGAIRLALQGPWAAPEGRAARPDWARAGWGRVHSPGPRCSGSGVGGSGSRGGAPAVGAWRRPAAKYRKEGGGGLPNNCIRQGARQEEEGPARVRVRQVIRGRGHRPTASQLGMTFASHLSLPRRPGGV